MAQHIAQLRGDLSAAREAQLPPLSTDEQLFQALQLGNTRHLQKKPGKLLQQKRNVAERIYSVGELLPLLTQNSPEFMLTKALVSVPDRAFLRGKHEWSGLEMRQMA